MKKILISVLVTVFFLVSNFVIPTTLLAQEKGPPKPKEWKGEGKKIEFHSMPTMTIKDFLEGKKPERQVTVWGTLNFPANAPEKNAPVVVIMHGGGGIYVWEEYWMKMVLLK